MENAKGRRILLVDDDRENVDLLTDFIAREGHNISHCADAPSALHRVKAWRPHVILLDVNMPGMSGLELIPKIRALGGDDYSAIMLTTSNSTLEDVQLGIEAGADDYLIKPFRIQELAARIRALARLKDLHDSLRRANHRIEELSSTDDLTGLMNLRALSRRAEDEVLRCRRFRKPLSAVLVNLDGFSQWNERLGLTGANHLLKETGGLLRRCLRSVDLLGRLGSDEFLAILPETDLAGGEFVAERIREALEKAEFKSEKQGVRLTACVGVAGFPEDRGDGDLSELFRNVHEALRSAKGMGPNRVEIYSFT